MKSFTFKSFSEKKLQTNGLSKRSLARFSPNIIITLLLFVMLPFAVSAQCPANYQCINHMGDLAITFELEAAGAAADQNLACQFVERLGGTINPSDDTDCSGGSFTIGTTTYTYVGDDGGGNTPITLTFSSGISHDPLDCPADYGIAEAIGCGQTADNGCLSIIFQDTETTNNCTSSNGYLSIILDLDSNDDGTDDCGPYTLQTSGVSPIDFGNPSIFQYTSGTYNDATSKADVYIFKFTDVITGEEFNFLYDFRAQFGTCPADAPVLFIDKSIFGSNTYSFDGDTINYQYAVTSSENISDVVVRDDKVVGGFATFAGGDDGDNILEVGETWIFTATYSIVAPDDISAGSVVNIARATGEDSNGIPVLSDFDSETATYVPCVPPAITTQPNAQEVCAGDSASFSVVDTGTAPTYQWQENGGDLANGGVYSGVDSATLNISDATGLNGNMYQVIITEGCSTTSNSVTLTVNALPVADAGTGGTIDCNTLNVQIGTAGAAGFTYAWTPTEGLNDATLPNPTADPDATTTYSLVVTETATGCVSTNTAEVTVTVDEDLPVADAGTGGTIDCNTLNVQIGTAGAAGFTYAWTPTTGLDNATLPNPTADPDATTTYSLVVTETATGCVSTNTAEVTVTVDEDLPVADAGTGGTIDCNTLNVQIGTAGAAGFTYAWTPTTGLDNATLPNPTADPDATTTYSLVVTETATGCVSTNTAEVTVTVDEDLPVADAGTGGTIDCNTLNVQIGTAGAAGFTYAWTPTTGLDNATLPNPTADPDATTTYSLVVTETATGCVSTNTAEVTVTVDEDLPVADAGTGGTIDCNTLNVQIGTAGAAGFTYAWTPTEGLNDATLPNPTADPDATTTYSLVVTETATGCVSTNTAEVTVTVDEDLPVADAGTGGTIDCNTLNVQIGTAGAAGFTYAWTPTTGLDNATLPNPTADPDATTTYSLVVTETATGCVSTNTAEVTVTVDEDLPVADAGTGGTIDCNTLNVQIGTAGAAGFTYAWTPTTGLDNATLPNPTADPDATTTYSLVVTETATGCVSTNTAEVTVTVDEDLPVADAGTGGTIDCNTLNVQIGTAGAAGFTYAWLPTEGLNDATLPNPTADPDATTTYSLVVTETATGCVSTNTAEVTVTVDEDLPVADAGTGGTIDCNTLNVQIGTAGAAGFTYAWTPTTGLDNATLPNPTADPDATTTYSLVVTETATGCVSTNTAEVTVTVDEDLPVADAGTGGTIDCNTLNVQIGTAGAAGFTYAWTPTTGLDNATLPNPTADPDATTTYSLVVTETATGCVSTNTAEVTVTVDEDLPVADAGTGGTIDCNTLNVQIGTAGAAGFTYAWLPTEGLNDATLPNPTADPDATTTYSLVVTETATGCVSTNTAEVTVTVDEDLPVADAGTGGTIDCNTLNVQIGTAGAAGFTYAWTPTTGLDNATLPNPTADPDATTTYSLVVTETATGCVSTNTAEVTVTVDEDLPVADAGTGGTIDCNTLNVQIGTAGAAGFTYAWTPTEGLNDATLPNPTADPDATTTYSLVVTETATGCVSTNTAEVTVTVDEDLPVADAGTGGTIDCNTLNVQIGTAGAAGFTYAWLPTTGLDNATLPNPTADPDATTTYSLVVTETATGCVSTNTAEVTVTVDEDLPVADAGTGGTIDCNTLNVQIGTAGAAGFTYAWTPTTGLDNATLPNPTADPDATTTYSLVVTETATGCVSTNTAEVTVTVDEDLPVADAGTGGTIDCNTLNVQIGTAGAAGFTYAWTPTTGLDNATLPNPTADPDATTTYSLVVTETATGCVSTNTAEVTVTVDEDLPVADAGTGGTIDCNTLNVQIGTAGAAGFTYAWLPTEGLDNATLPNPTADPDATTTYSLVVTETATGCVSTNTAEVTVTVDEDLPVADAGTGGTIDCNTLNVQIGTAGAAGFTYAWTPTTGLDNATLPNPTADPDATTTYSLVVTETATGCVSTNTAEVTVTVDEDLPVADAGTGGTIDCNTLNVQIGTAGAAGFTYAWLPTTGLDNATLPNPTADPDATTTYSLVVTETATGCVSTNTAEVTVTVDEDLPVADAGTGGTIDCNTLNVQIGTAGAAGFTYAWTPTEGLNDATLPNPTADPDATTTYSLVVTETATGCVSTNTAEVTVTVDEDLPVADAGTGGTIDCNTLNVQIGTAGAAGFTYAWLPTTGLDNATLPNPTADPDATTTYSLVVTETATGCVSTNTAEVTVTVDEDLPVADAGTGGTIDCNTLNVQIGTAGAAGFTYAWTPTTGLDNATLPNPTADPDATTTYSLVVTETATGCVSTNTAEVTVTVDEDLPVADAGTGGTIDCNTLNVQIGTAGAAGFTYAWTPTTGLDNATLPNPTADPDATTTYSLVVTETATGCVSTNTAEVTVTVDEDLPVADAGTGGTIDCNTLNVQIGTAGAAGFTYAWTPTTGLDNATLPNPTADPDATTTYSLVVTETATGCVSTNTAEVTVTVDEDLPVADAGTGGTIDCNTLNVQIGTAGAAGFTYAWLPTEGLNDATLPNPTADPDATTTYSLVVTETATGCVSTNTAEVTVTVDEDLPVADAGTGGTIDCNTLNVQIGTAGAAGFTYAWTPTTGLDNATLPNPTADPDATTTYSLVVTETATGCVSTNTAEVTVTVDEDLPVADAGTGGTIDCNTLNVQIGTAGAAGFTYAWLPTTGLDNATLPNPTADPDATTTYSLVVTETATGCVSTNTAEVTVTVDEDLPVADAGTGGTIDCNTLNVQIGTAGAAGFTYAWTPTEGLNDATLPNPTADPDATTTYSLVVTETATGCVSTNTAEVTVTVDEDLPVADAGTGGTIDCNTLNVQIGTAGAAGFTYAWTPTEGLNDATLPNPTADPDATTTYSLVVTETATGCVSPADTVEVTVDNVDVRVRECDAIDADICNPGDPDYAANFNWIDSGTYFSSNATHKLTFIEYDNGTALIRGSTQIDGCSLELYIFLENKKNWAEWSHPDTGGSFKEGGCSQAEKEDLMYYTIDGDKSFAQATGGNCTEEGFFVISQMPDPNDPSTPNYGVLVGPGAALWHSVIGADGLAGWGWMGPPDDDRRYSIDFNFLLDCQPVTDCVSEYPDALNCMIDQDLVNANCDGTATAEVSGGKEPYSYQWSDGQTTQTAYNLNVGEHTVIVTDANGAQSYCSVTISDVVPYVQIDLKVFLEGPFNSNTELMNDDLRSNGDLPTSGPYDAANCDASVFSTIGNNAIVDWVWVELRDKNSNTTVLAATSALIQRDGDVVSTDGVSPVSFNINIDDYYVAIAHRNHLGIITADPVKMTCNIVQVNLTQDPTLIQGGTSAVTDVTNGNCALAAADCDGNGQIQNSDLNGILPLLGISSYSYADLDMNGQVQNSDINVLLPNLGLGSQVSRVSGNTGTRVIIVAPRR